MKTIIPVDGNVEPQSVFRLSVPDDQTSSNSYLNCESVENLFVTLPKDG